VRRDARFLQRIQKFGIREYDLVGTFIFNRVAAGIRMRVPWNAL
jgi:hypothetical protein